MVKLAADAVATPLLVDGVEVSRFVVVGEGRDIGSGPAAVEWNKVAMRGRRASEIYILIDFCGWEGLNTGKSFV